MYVQFHIITNNNQEIPLHRLFKNLECSHLGAVTHLMFYIIAVAVANYDGA